MAAAARGSRGSGMWLERVAGTEWEERRMKLRLLGVWWFGGEGGEIGRAHV